MTAEAPPVGPPHEPVQAVGGPVSSGWREGILTRAKEIDSQRASMSAGGQETAHAKAVRSHVKAAREAAEFVPSGRFRRVRNLMRTGPLMERAMSNLDAAEADLLRFAPAEYVLGQLPCLLKHVRSHILPTDPRRQEFERVAQRLGVPGPGQPVPAVQGQVSLSKEDRGKIASITRSASREAQREQVRVRSFRNILVGTAVAMTVLAIGIAMAGFLNPTLIPMCFAPQQSGQDVVVVCPTRQSDPFVPSTEADAQSATKTEDIDEHVQKTASSYDLFVVELVGLAAAAISTAAAVRSIRGSSERFGVPVALAALKLPTGAVTAFLGVLLMRGQFVPGLSALDTSAQILAWALVFGYAQQLFTRLVDRQGQTVLDSVRGADKPARQP